LKEFRELPKHSRPSCWQKVSMPILSASSFTPDLMPSDITGTSIYNSKTNDFEFKQGPLFTNIVLADEINRAPAKTQAALI